MSNAEQPAGVPDSSTKNAESPARSEQKLELLLTSAASLMAQQGYAQTSIRNVAAKTGFSLAGMYYYFKNKEDLLYQIQLRTFSSLLAAQERSLANGGDPEEKLRRLVRGHLDFFTEHASELKVCTFELQSLQGERYQTVEGLRRRYFRCLAEVIGEILGVAKRAAVADQLVRHHALFVFGMLNWIFMWYEPERDGPVEQLGDEMITLVLEGLRGGGGQAGPELPDPPEL
jgi:AcrR family transcriptional regulator